MSIDSLTDIIKLIIGPVAWWWFGTAEFKLMFYAYVILNKTRDKIYVGQTDDLKDRLRKHNDPSFDKNSYASINSGKWIFVHREEFSTRKMAMKREKELKSSRGRDFIRRKILGR